MHPPNPYGLPPHLSVDRSSQMPYDIWAAFCMRCTGNMVKVSDGHRYPEDAAHAAREHSMTEHPISPEDWLTEEQQEAAVALGFSVAETRVLDAADDGEFYEDPTGFYYYDLATDKPRPVARARAINLIMLGYLRFTVHGPQVRRFWLSETGEEARRLWYDARRQGVVRYAEKDSAHGVSAKQRRAYLLIANGHPAAGRQRRSAPAAAKDVQSAPAPAAVWEDDGGPCPEVQAERRASPAAEEDQGEPTAPTCLQVAERAAALATEAADKAMHAVARSRGRDTARLDAVMFAAHEAAADAEKYARMAAEDAAAGQTRTVRAFAAHAVTCAVQAQRSAGVKESAAELAGLLERQRTEAEQEEAERERREWDARYEAEMRAETGMDADNRVRLEGAKYTASREVPTLGWSDGMVRAMEVAEAGRLTRRDGFAWDGRRKVARHRVLALANAGFLSIGRGTDRRITPTPMGSLTLYLARLAPEHVHADDKAAYEARWAAVGRRRGKMPKEERKRAALQLPPLDPSLVQRFVRPVTIAEQEALAAREAAAAEQTWEDEGGAVPNLVPHVVETAVAAPSAPTGHPAHEQLELLALETVQTYAPAAGPGPLVVVPCSRGKLPYAAPAGQLYTGPLHAMARAAANALTARGGRVLVLSGRRRLFGLDEVVEPYDEVMPERLTDQDVAQLRAEAVRHGAADADQIVLLTPSRYTRAAQRIWPHATAALEGSSGIGVMRGRLAAITRTGELPHPPALVAEPDEPGCDNTAHSPVRLQAAEPIRRRRRNRSRGPRQRRPGRTAHTAPPVTRASNSVPRGAQCTSSASAEHGG